MRSHAIPRVGPETDLVMKVARTCGHAQMSINDMSAFLLTLITHVSPKVFHSKTSERSASPFRGLCPAWGWMVYESPLHQHTKWSDRFHHPGWPARGSCLFRHTIGKTLPATLILPPSPDTSDPVVANAKMFFNCLNRDVFDLQWMEDFSRIPT